MIKKISSVCLSLLLVLGLVACSSNKSTITKDNDTNKTEDTDKPADSQSSDDKNSNLDTEKKDEDPYLDLIDDKVEAMRQATLSYMKQYNIKEAAEAFKHMGSMAWNPDGKYTINSNGKDIIVSGPQVSVSDKSINVYLQLEIGENFDISSFKVIDYPILTDLIKATRKINSVDAKEYEDFLKENKDEKELYVKRDITIDNLGQWSESIYIFYDDLSGYCLDYRLDQSK